MLFKHLHLIWFICRRKYPTKATAYIESPRNVKDNEEHVKDDDLLLYCDGDEAEKNKDRLLSFDAKKYELVTTDEKFDDADEFEFNNSESFESSPSDKCLHSGKKLCKQL